MSTTFTFENLMGGSQKAAVQVPGTIAIGQAFSRGTLLGKLTATHKWQSVDYDAKANFEDFGISVEAVDTTEGELPSTIFTEGEFNQNSVVIGYGDDYDDWKQTLIDHGIYLRDSVTTGGV